MENLELKICEIKNAMNGLWENLIQLKEEFVHWRVDIRILIRKNSQSDFKKIKNPELK